MDRYTALLIKLAESYWSVEVPLPVDLRTALVDAGLDIEELKDKYLRVNAIWTVQDVIEDLDDYEDSGLQVYAAELRDTINSLIN